MCKLKVNLEGIQFPENEATMLGRKIGHFFYPSTGGTARAILYPHVFVSVTVKRNSTEMETLEYYIVSFFFFVNHD